MLEDSVFTDLKHIHIHLYNITINLDSKYKYFNCRIQFNLSKINILLTRKNCISLQENLQTS